MPQQIRDNTFMDRMISDAVGGVRGARDAAGGDRSLRRAGLHRRRSARARSGCAWRSAPAPARVRAMVLRQVAWMTVIGGAIGLAGAVGVGYSAASILFELKAWDPMVLTVSAVLLTIVALGAGLVPAHRASQVDPMRALRYE